MIVITTPTGDIGHRVLELVLKKTQDVRVIARDPSRIPLDIRDRIEIIEGSHSDASVIERALIDAHALFWLIPPEPLMKSSNVDEAYVEFARPAVAAIRRNGVKHVVAVSALGRGWPKSAGLASANIKADDLLWTTGVALRVLMMPSFMDNLLRQAQTIQEKSTFSSPLNADLKLPTVATSDIAAVAAGLLTDTNWEGQADVPVLGPEDISQNEMAAILSDVLGKPIHFEQTPMEAYRTRMAAHMSAGFAQGLADMMTAKNEGMDNTASRTPAVDTPTTFRQWSEEVLKPALDQ